MRKKLNVYSFLRNKRNKYYFYFFSLLNINLLILFSFFSSSKNHFRALFNAGSKIHLVINSKNEQNILSSLFYKDPSDIIVNGISKKESCNRICYLEQNYNNITLIFDDDIESCEMMFDGLNNIKEIDLSDFDSSKVTSMKNMFKDCKQLEKINFGNIKTSLVRNMENLFATCEKLKSIDVSNFDTSQVTTMAGMFSSCKLIKYIDASNFQTS